MLIRSYVQSDLARLTELTIETFRPFYEESFRPLVGELIARPSPVREPRMRVGTGIPAVWPTGRRTTLLILATPAHCGGASRLALAVNRKTRTVDEDRVRRS